ncbi:MAG: DEAD/DEAH box helicase family protein, partial [Fimbriimonadales bacterium]|nr:DEAD/DEAH box helicase family protein [Fimbriimonadales bacterium]
MRSRRGNMGAPSLSARQYYARLENRLVLLAWARAQLGYDSNAAMLRDCRNAQEGYGADGHSFLYHHLLARSDRLKISPEQLACYDENIRRHVEHISRGRGQLTLRYFQYLAALLTELFLDRLKDNRARLLKELNDFVEARNARRRPDEPHTPAFTETDLNKLAFWMATGSGKTLLLHLNYLQFLHHAPFQPDNIVLITPNEGLSEQHLQELKASGIPAQRFDPNRSSLFCDSKAVQVIEITKLVQEKTGGGVSVPVEAFEGRNLIFVDEGHKGAGGRAWRTYREALGQTGFTFEYSATFGQALSAAGRDELTEEYAKAILFDYSYRYFYEDGFGKDFRVLNLQGNPSDEQQATLFVGNLLAFYEQLRLYDDQRDALHPYHLERPLWVFVGSTVNAVYTENKQTRSDVLTVARWLHRFASDRNWAVKCLNDALNGTTGLRNSTGSDVFEGQFAYLRTLRLSTEELYNDILQRLFHAPSGGSLRLCVLKRAQGEIGLKIGLGERYFGLIYIGDVAAFKKLVEESPDGLVWEEDAISDSLFRDINRPDSSLSVLIGARKFIEGWNSWRVSSMGLLNIGRNEGAQIIQLFGRGVRLKGKEMSLKRSAALEGTHPPHIRVLETLNIFAVRANYMQQFRDYLEREGVEVEPPVQLMLPILPNEEFLKRGLLAPRLPQDADFAREQTVLLAVDKEIAVRHDATATVQVLTGEGASQGKRAVQGERIPSESLNLIDWQAVYLEVLAHKQRRGLSNLVVTPAVLRTIIEQADCTLSADERVLRPHTRDDCALLRQAVARLLCRYVDRFYQNQRERWETQNLVYRPLDKADSNLAFAPSSLQEAKAGYLVSVPRSEKELIDAIEQLLHNQQKLYECDKNGLERIYFDRHLYQPLLVESGRQIQISPPALTESERRFVQDLRDYWQQAQNSAMAGKELFLLRNLSRGRGVGFFEGRGFYPDFILWVLEGQRQRIVFVEPHGMLHAKAYIHDEKARLWERLPNIAQQLAQRYPLDCIVELDAYIISATPYELLRERYDDGTW